MLRARLISAVVAGVLSFAPLSAQDRDPDVQPQDLKRLSIEELAQLDVTSATRRTERLSDTAAAVSVVRGDDVRRAGAVVLAEAMRLADGIDVARVNGSSWGVSTRGFNISTANKLLVLVDGRSTYASLFGGTFWDVQDMVLADLDRIEVIRGPGGTVWGPNAMNGVINIISKPVAETQGNVLTVIGGVNEKAIVAARHGGRAGRGHFRVYGKYRTRGAQAFADGASAEDDVRFGQAGFRLDSSVAAPARWSVAGDLYRGTNGFAGRPDGDVSGGNLVARYARRSGLGETTLLGYYDRSHRTVPRQFEERRHAGEVDAHHRISRGRHDITAGGTVRGYRSDDLGSATFRFEPRARNGWTANVFVQDELTLAEDRAYLILGSKIGRNNFTGFELQPNVRVRLHPGERQMIWAAVSRAVRLPTRLDHDLHLLNPMTGEVTLSGSNNFDSESVVALEAGYRRIVHPRLSIDTAAFSNRYDDLRSQQRLPSGLVELQNRLNARTNGVEVAATAVAKPSWRLHGSVTWLRKRLSFDPGSTDTTGGVAEGNDPAYLASVRSFLDLPHDLALDVIVRHTGRRPAPVVPRYTEMNVRVGWLVRPAWELSIIGQNLLHDRHRELASLNGPTFEFRRSVFARSIWRF